MKHTLYLVIIVVLFLSGCAVNQQRIATDKDVKIFFASTYPDTIDIRIGNAKKTLVYTERLSEQTVTRIVSIPEHGTYNVYYRNKPEDDWTIWESYTPGKPFRVKLQAGKCHAIVLDTLGGLWSYPLEYEHDKQAKVAFLNLSGELLNRMEVAEEYLDSDVAYTDGLHPNTITNFVDAPDGEYGLYWETQDSGDKGEHFYYPDDEDNVYRATVTAPMWYIFTVYPGGDGTEANFYDITPQDIQR